MRAMFQVVGTGEMARRCRLSSIARRHPSASSRTTPRTDTLHAAPLLCGQKATLCLDTQKSKRKESKERLGSGFGGPTSRDLAATALKNSGTARWLNKRTSPDKPKWTAQRGQKGKFGRCWREVHQSATSNSKRPITIKQDGMCSASGECG